MATVGFNKKQFFFDRQIVIDAVGRAGAKNLSKAGSFIRRSARSSLRRRKKINPLAAANLGADSAGRADGQGQ